MKHISYFILLALTFAFGCGSDDPASSSEKQIISFTLSATDHTFLDEDLSGTIDHENGTVTLVLPPSSDLTGLIPNILLSPGASVSPGSGSEQDFSAPVIYTVTAEDGSTQGYTVTISVALYSDKTFLSFDFPAESNSTILSDVKGIINTDDLTASLEVPYNSDRSALTPNFTLSPGASSSPASGEVQDFANPVTYTITAEDGSTNEYKVSVGYAESQAQVLSFSFLAEENDALFVDVEGSIEGTLVSLEVPATTEVSNLKGQATLSTGASTSIDLQIGRDYTNDIIMNVTGQDLSSDNYTIHVFETNEKAILLELAAANPDNTLNWIEETDISTWEGINYEGGKTIGLALHDKYISSLPSFIGKLVHLQNIEITNDKTLPGLSELPPEIGNLVKLETIHFADNQISEIPNEIGNLINLIDLSISSNNLTTLPGSLADLTNLFALYVYDNQLTSLPDNIGELSNLERMELQNNQLSSLPSSISQLTKLKRIYIGQNSFSAIPSLIFDITTLTDFNTAGLELTSVPNEIGNLTNLRYLVLENNGLTTLPESIANLTTLSGLWIKNNNITLIPWEICALTTNHGIPIYKDTEALCEDAP